MLTRVGVELGLELRLLEILSGWPRASFWNSHASTVSLLDQLDPLSNQAGAQELTLADWVREWHSHSPGSWLQPGPDCCRHLGRELVQRDVLTRSFFLVIF